MNDSEAPDVSFSVRYQGLLLQHHMRSSLGIGLIGSILVAICMIVHCEGRWEEELVRSFLLSRSPAGHSSLPIEGMY